MRKKRDANIAKKYFSWIDTITRNNLTVKRQIAEKLVKKPAKRSGAMKILIISKAKRMSNVFKSGEKNILVIQ